MNSICSRFQVNFLHRLQASPGTRFTLRFSCRHLQPENKNAGHGLELDVEREKVEPPGAGQHRSPRTFNTHFMLCMFCGPTWPDSECGNLVSFSVPLFSFALKP